MLRTVLGRRGRPREKDATMLEGDRPFDIAWGTATGGLCFLLGALAVAHWFRARRAGRPSLFGAADPDRTLEFGYAVFALVMGGTNVGCRFIAHAYLAGVHEGYALLTLLTAAVLVPALAGARERTARPPRRAPAGGRQQVSGPR